MTELLFIGITVFFIYVVFQAIGNEEEKPDANKEEVKAAETPEPVKKEPVKQEAAQASPPAATKPASKRTSKATKTTPPKAPAASPEPTPPASAATDSVKNPKTGEVAKVTGNYAFAKRWIKDALVEEGLLDKVYKNNELDADTTAKIHAALEQLKSMAKYQ